MAASQQAEFTPKNEQWSFGPGSQEEKERSRLDALKHGMRAVGVDVLPNEDPDEFARRLEAWFHDRNPRQEAQCELVRQLAILSWKRDRIDRYEIASTSQRVRDAIEACGDASPDRIAAVALMASFDPSTEAERMRRYQFALRREFNKTLDAFAKLKARDLKELEICANEANSRCGICANEANSVREAAISKAIEALSGPTICANEANSTGKITSPICANEAKSINDRLTTVGANEANSSPDIQISSRSDEDRSRPGIDLLGTATVEQISASSPNEPESAEVQQLHRRNRPDPARLLHRAQTVGRLGTHPEASKGRVRRPTSTPLISPDPFDHARSQGVGVGR